MLKKIVFMGTPFFAVPILKSLYQNGYPVSVVYTQPPQKSQRGQKINKSPIQGISETLKIDYRTPSSLKNNKEEYTNAISEANNELEKKWRRKIYNEHTPRGNVYMHYDAYKMGFSYYSDTSIPNPILNAVAMQYCIMFKCCDLFIDQNIISKENESPLIKIHHIEKKKTKNNKNVNKGDVTKTDDLPFAKLKNYNKEKINEKKTNKKSGEEKKDNPFVNKVTNKFIHLGKVYKLNWLQPIKKEQTTIKFESKYLDDLQKETDLQKQVISYKDYKNTATAAAGATTKILH